MNEITRGILVAQMDLALRHYVRTYQEWDKFHRQSLKMGSASQTEDQIHDVVMERMARPAVVKTWAPLVQPAPCEVAS